MLVAAFLKHLTNHFLEFLPLTLDFKYNKKNPTSSNVGVLFLGSS